MLFGKVYGPVLFLNEEETKSLQFIFYFIKNPNRFLDIFVITICFLKLFLFLFSCTKTILNVLCNSFSKDGILFALYWQCMKHKKESNQSLYCNVWLDNTAANPDMSL